MHPLINKFGQGSLQRLVPHRNAGLEIVLIRKGHLLWQTEGRIERLQPGTVFFTLPDQEHGSAREFEPGHEWVYVVLSQREQEQDLPFSLPTALALSEDAKRESTHALTHADRHSHLATQGMRTVLPELVHELEHPGSMHDEKVVGLATLAVIELVRCIKATEQSSQIQRESDSRKRVRQLLDQIAENPAHDWSLAEMERLCKIGRTQLGNLFNEESGDTPITFVNRMRFLHSCRLLVETDLSITQIAMECGFQSSQYFARVFGTFSGGMNARAYRNQR